MQNEIVQIFSSAEFGEITTLLIDDEPWFAGIDVAKALGYSVPKTTVSKHVDKDDTQSIQIRYSGQNRNIVFVNESGLYTLIFGSKLESAKKFKRWVTSEVLPSIRKNGSYQIPQTTDGKIQLLAQGITETNQRVEKLTNEMKSVKTDISTAKTEIERLKLDLPLLPVEADNVSSAVKKRVVEILGGKKSRAYHDKSICQMAFSDAYKELKRQFDVRSYKNIKRGQIENAISVAMGYEPPVFLKEKIEKMNGKAV